MRWDWMGEAAVGCLLAFIVGTLAEYVFHRLMHAGKVLGKLHVDHHKDGSGQGWFGEFRDYFLPSVVVLWVGFLYSVAAGIGIVVGGTLYGMLAAYAHQVQHERPELVFWLPRPVHYLHHKHKMWHHNFGILIDVWDRVFGTYRAEEWNPERRPFQHRPREFFQIKWF